MLKCPANILRDNDLWPFAFVTQSDNHSVLADNFGIHWRQQKAMHFTRTFLNAQAYNLPARINGGWVREI
jgi:hypothetical protein